MNKSKVYIVGAGPGDIGLITIKTIEVIKIADCVIYDNLINNAILDYCKKDVQLIYAGKSGNKHTLEQSEINNLLLDLSKKNKIIVRLKGGDPFLFGRGAEEAFFLNNHNIDFEIIPGIPAGIGVPIYAGIPITHRDSSSSVAFITGHKAKNENLNKIDISGIASSVDTLVFYMGVRNLKNIIKKVINAELPLNTPVGIIQEGTYNHQKTIVGTLENIVLLAKENKISPPALIIIGKVIKYREKLNWFERRAFSGKRVLLTRNRQSDDKLYYLFSQNGAITEYFPTIDIINIEPNPDLEKAINNINEYDWIFFTSRNAVKIFFKNLFQSKNDVRKLDKIKIAVIGYGTMRRLQEYYITADFIPEKFTTDVFAKQFVSENELENKKILIPCSDIANPELKKILEKGGANVDAIVVYKTKIPEYGTEYINAIKKQILNNSINYITFTSSSTVDNFAKILSLEFINKNKNNIHPVSIGPKTTEKLNQYGLNPVNNPVEYTFDGMINSLLNK